MIGDHPRYPLADLRNTTPVGYVDNPPDADEHPIVWVGTNVGEGYKALLAGYDNNISLGIGGDETVWRYLTVDMAHELVRLLTIAILKCPPHGEL